MKKERNGRNVIIGMLIAMVLVMSVGYAVLTQKLYVNGTAQVLGNTWGVRFTDLAEPSLEENTLAGNAISKSANLNANSTVMTFDVGLEKPNDTVIYNLNIENYGNLKAEVSSIINTTNVNGNPISYTVSGINEGDVLAPGAKAPITVVIKYENTAPAIEATTSFTFSTVLALTQTDKKATIN